MTLHADNPTPNLLERLRRALAPLVDRLNMPPEWWVPLVCVCLGKAPGALTAQELSAERNRIAAIYKNL